VEKNSLTKYHSLDGLRGLAALNVALAHFFGAFYSSLMFKSYPYLTKPEVEPSNLFIFLQSPFMNIFYNGHFAVLIFFVLSGYVLSIPFYKNYTNKSSILTKRLLGRYIRLNLPVAASILISYFILTNNLYYNIEVKMVSEYDNKWFYGFFTEIKTFSFMLKSLFYDAIVNKNEYFNVPLWTIYIEFIGSIFLLLFYIIVPKTSKKIEFMLIFFLFGVLYYFYKTDSIYFISIFLGAMLHHIKYLSKKAIFVFACIGLYFGAYQFDNIIYNYLPAINYNEAILFDQKTFYNTIGAFFLVLVTIHGFASKFFTSKILLFLGKISFSLYLIHFIILCSVSSYFYVYFSTNILLNLLLFITILIILSTIFYKSVDKTAIKLSHWFSQFLFTKLTFHKSTSK